MRVPRRLDATARRTARLMEPVWILSAGRPQPSQASVLASSGRSGSTWLADMLTLVLRLQQVFEPLHPKHNTEVRRLTGFGPDPYQSVYLRPSNAYPDWDQVLHAVLTGRMRNSWTDAVPTVWFPKGYLIKSIRANLMLGYISDNFNSKLIYLVRHPCAVIHSRLRVHWDSNPRALLKQERLVEDHLRPWVSRIERETNVVGSQALIWAVENLVAQRDLSLRPHFRIFYEHLVLDPAQEIQRIAQYVGRSARAIPEGVVERSSRTSHQFRIEAPVDRLISWKVGMAQDDQSRILDWVDRLGVAWYSTDTQPNGLSGPQIPITDGSSGVVSVPDC